MRKVPSMSGYEADDHPRGWAQSMDDEAQLGDTHINFCAIGSDV